MLSESLVERNSNDKRVLKYVDEIFEEYDIDKSRYLSKMEFAPAINGILGKFGVDACCNEDIIDIFNLLDANGDETISKEEFTALIVVIDLLIKKNGKNVLKNDLSFVKKSLE